MPRLPLVSATLAAVMAVAPLTSIPAQARGGSVALTIDPQGRDADVLRGGFQIYSLIKGFKNRNRARIDQRGTGNAAAVAQHGTGNAAEVFQRGKGHSATIEQTGNDNLFGVFQFGRHTSSTITQTGNGRTGLVIQGGW